MQGNSPQQRKAQLDKEEREHLEDIVTEMRERVEANVRYQLEEYDLEDEPAEDASLRDEQEDLVEAIELEIVDGDEWADGYEQYITGVGYTIVNRLAALRCMEVRGFIDDEVTAFREDGLTPAADRLVTEEFMLEEEAVLEAYRNACDDLAGEIDILFDRSTAYSLLNLDDDTFEDLCGMLDEVADEVWRADDVLGWVYEYYNVELLDDLRRKGDREGLEPEDVPAANQFYTPHWVVRMLTDNSLGKLYLEDQGELQSAVDRQNSLIPAERKNRPLSPDESPDITDFCTYLVPSEEEGEPPEFDGPEDLRVIDPACGSGHFLLYAFDVLERIWRAETDLDYSDIPREILRHNLYGVDLDMRACQLAAFNLYLKGRTRTEAEGASGFDMPEIGIVCADAKVADVDGIDEVFDEVADGKSGVEDALRRILDAFEEIHGLGSLLDVRGTLGDLFEDFESDDGRVQISLEDDPRDNLTLAQTLRSLREALDKQRDERSFLAQDLRSFVRLLNVLVQNYDVALMNPPYGSRKRMPDTVTEYVENSEGFDYTPEYYINFFEVCENLVKDSGRVGMLIPRSFMFKRRFRQFRLDFVGDQGGFDFLAEYGLGILDNATVRTVGTVVRVGQSEDEVGEFIRLSDVGTREKETTFLDSVFGNFDNSVTRVYHIDLTEFQKVPWTPLSYWTPRQIRDLHSSGLKLDPAVANIDGESIGTAAKGMDTGKNSRFIQTHWESEDDSAFIPYAKGGSDAWVKPETQLTLNWYNDGSELARYRNSNLKNSQHYQREGLTWTYAKETGRRFGYFPPGGAFDGKGSMFFSDTVNPWNLMAVLNSSLYHNLFLSLTPERDWQVGDIGRIPWIETFEKEQFTKLAKQQYSLVLESAFTEPTSPHYKAPQLFPKKYKFFYDHPYTESDGIVNDTNPVVHDPSERIEEMSRRSLRAEQQRQDELEKVSDKIDNLIYNTIDIHSDIREELEQEIFLRTGEDPNNREVSDPDSVPEISENLNGQVKDLVHHFAMEAIREEAGGIIPLEGTDEQADMLDRIVERFEVSYDEYAADRLVEVDDILGAESADDEAYPNLRAFIENDLFEYHVDTMENTPIFWKISTQRLLADAKGEGFACFVDYHQLNASLFDRLSNQYLESRKAELRERRSAANRRQNDESLSTSERAEATEEFEFCSSALEQIAELEEVMGELGSTSERDFDDDYRALVKELVPKVAAFREETAERIDTLETLRERKGEEWFQDTFSNKFWESVREWREEWLDALDELEHACEEYAKPSDEPVEAHLADLFDYFNWRLKGSDYHSSRGILFMTYYFEREGCDLLDDNGDPHDVLTQDERMLASLAMGVDDVSLIDAEYLEQIADDEGVDDVDDISPLGEFKALAEEIDDRCQTVYRQVPSAWSDRALSEITTAGYQPNQKHGVAINITPLAEKNIVPEIVEDKVL